MNFPSPSVQTPFNFPENIPEQQDNGIAYQEFNPPVHNYYEEWNIENQQPLYEQVQQPAYYYEEYNRRAFFNGYGIHYEGQLENTEPIMNPSTPILGVYPEQAIQSNIGPMKGCNKNNKSAELPVRGRTRSDRSQLPSGEEAKEILGLDLMENGVINLENLSTRIQYELLARRIKQKTFAKHVLNRSQGTYSDLMRVTKSWEKLTNAGRNTYMKIYEWIQSDNDEKDALALKDKEIVKEVTRPVVETADKPKKSRTKFTIEQQDALNAHFSQSPLSYGSDLEELAQRLGLEGKVVKTYFTNARRKLRDH